MMFSEKFYQHPFFQLVPGAVTDGVAHPEALDDRMRQALEVYTPQFAAIDPEGYLVPRGDVLGVLEVVARVAPQLATLREDIARVAPTFAKKLIDELPDLALAVACAHGRYEHADDRHDAVAGAVTAASRVRESFLRWLEALADKGFADDRRLTEIRRGTGYEDLASDVEALTAMLRALRRRSQGPRSPCRDESQ